MEFGGAVGGAAAGLWCADVEDAALEFAFAGVAADVREIAEGVDDEDDIGLAVDDGSDDIEVDGGVGVAVDGLTDGAWVEGGGLLVGHAGVEVGLAGGVLADSDDDVAALGVGECHGVPGELGASGAGELLPVLCALEVDLLVLDATVDDVSPVLVRG